ncbi:13916_t:CDS:2, partial [Cetraspora pellucida]
VSLVGVSQDAMREINEENAIFSVLVKNYAGQNYSFTVKVIFPHNNSRFKHLKSSIQPSESTIFIVGQVEVIENDLYTNAINISYVDVPSATKKSSNCSQIMLEDSKSVRSRLLIDNDCYSSKLVEMEDEDNCNKYVDSYSSEHDYMVEYTSGYLEGNIKCKSDITLESERETSYHEVANKNKGECVKSVKHIDLNEKDD